MIRCATKKLIVLKIENLLKIKVVNITTPPQGYDSDVFFITTEDGREYLIKHGANVVNDVLALKLIKESGQDIPIPKVFGSFSLENKTVVVLEKIHYPQLESIPTKDMFSYIEPMIQILKKIHTITSEKTGYLHSNTIHMTWKEALLFKYSGRHPEYPWDKIVQRKGVDTQLIQKAIKNVVDKINGTTFVEGSYSLLHTDFNQKNLFVNPERHNIVSVIDWGEATYGDPLFDFARIRMFIFHFNLAHKALDIYYDTLALTKEEKVREDLYLVSQMLDYITWYSGKEDAFNISRLALHQGFMREYEW